MSQPDTQIQHSISLLQPYQTRVQTQTLLFNHNIKKKMITSVRNLPSVVVFTSVVRLMLSAGRVSVCLQHALWEIGDRTMMISNDMNWKWNIKTFDGCSWMIFQTRKKCMLVCCVYVSKCPWCMVPA